MELTFNMSLYDGEMEVYAKYKKEDIKKQHFYINRDAIFEFFICDGIERDFEICSVDLTMFDGYTASKVIIPIFSHSFEIKYKLKLSGQTGCCPYVREKITQDFTFIRWETFCYPMFFDDWDSFRNLGLKLCLIHIIIPTESEAISSEQIIDTKRISSSKKMISYISKKQGSDIFNCAIAPYTKLDFSFGSIYFLRSMDDKKKQIVEDAMNKALFYMNEHFGQRDLSSKITYASIPDGFGSFACADTGVVFIQESSFNRVENLNQIIHEFIHLGWNAKAKDSVQQTRFFDEAFTSYFETRVMRNLLCDETINGYVYGQRGVDGIKNGQYKLVPIFEYARMGYGDLSYTIGALCLEELCNLLGEELFDSATTAFLNNHRETPADFEDFCNEYKAFCGAVNEARLSQFFDDWIYSCEALKKYI